MKNIISIYKAIKKVNIFYNIPMFYTYIIALSFMNLYIVDFLSRVKKRIKDYLLIKNY